jgi:hypothetical protein
MSVEWGLQSLWNLGMYGLFSVVDSCFLDRWPLNLVPLIQSLATVAEERHNIYQRGIWGPWIWIE